MLLLDWTRTNLAYALPDGTIILDLCVNDVAEPAWKGYGGTMTASNGEKSDIAMEQPSFTERSLKRILRLEPGKAASVSGDGLFVTVTPSTLLSAVAPESPSSR